MSEGGDGKRSRGYMKLNSANGLRRSKKGAFTLVELLVVIAIMGILAALLLGVTRYAWRASKEAKAKTNIEKIYKALQESMLAKGEYPNPGDTNPHSLADLFSSDPTPGQSFRGLTNWLEITTNNLVDPWGHSYIYSRPSPLSCVVYSYGVDGQQNTGDDIVYGK
jgi:general secretion pathway protein G